MRDLALAPLTLLLSFGISGNAQQPAWGPTMMYDPIFAITYDTRDVRFEVAPASLEARCPDIDIPKGAKYWIYAHWQDADIEIFLISSRPSRVSGGAAVITKSGCILSLPDWVLTGDLKYGPQVFEDGKLQPLEMSKSVKFSDRILRGLADDLLHRYASAFGGKKNFLDAWRKQGSFNPLDGFPVLRAEFKRFSDSP